MHGQCCWERAAGAGSRGSAGRMAYSVADLERPWRRRAMIDRWHPAWIYVWKRHSWWDGVVSSRRYVYAGTVFAPVVILDLPFWGVQR